MAEKVQLKKLVWAAGGYDKYHNEGQADSMGGYQQEVNLVFPEVKKDGKVVTAEKVIAIQTKGKPTNAIPTSQRQFLKLMVALVETAGDKKGGFFADSFALNMKDNADWVGKLAESGVCLDEVYGNPAGKSAARRFVSIKTLLSVCSGLTAMRQSTLSRYPSAAKVENTVAEAEEEQVELVL
jgi:hypothetical protein